MITLLYNGFKVHHIILHSNEWQWFAAECRRSQTVLTNNVNYIYSSTKCVIQNIVQKFTWKELRKRPICLLDTAIMDEIWKQCTCNDKHARDDLDSKKIYIYNDIQEKISWNIFNSS